jgi:hypothetical protein
MMKRKKIKKSKNTLNLIYRKPKNSFRKESERTKNKFKKDKNKEINTQISQNDGSNSNKNEMKENKILKEVTNTTSTEKLSEKIDISVDKFSNVLDKEKILEIKTFNPELDYGNVEYKLKLVDLTKEKIQKRITQMEFRLREGLGKCFYQLGVEDNGNPLGLSEEELKISIESLQQMAQQIGANMRIINFYQGKDGILAEVLITKESIYESKDLTEVSIGLLGEEGSGKSTLVFNTIN